MTLSATAFGIRTGVYEYVRDDMVSPVGRNTETRYEPPAPATSTSAYRAPSGETSSSGAAQNGITELMNPPPILADTMHDARPGCQTTMFCNAPAESIRTNGCVDRLPPGQGLSSARLTVASCRPPERSERAKTDVM